MTEEMIRVPKRLLHELLCYYENKSETPYDNDFWVRQDQIAEEKLAHITERLHSNIHKALHHTNWDKIPAITSDCSKTYIRWDYCDSSIHASSKDYNLISLIKETIQIYLEETGDA